MAKTKPVEEMTEVELKERAEHLRGEISQIEADLGDFETEMSNLRSRQQAIKAKLDEKVKKNVLGRDYDKIMAAVPPANRKVADIDTQIGTVLWQRSAANTVLRARQTELRSIEARLTFLRLEAQAKAVRQQFDDFNGSVDEARAVFDEMAQSIGQFIFDCRQAGMNSQAFWQRGGAVECIPLLYLADAGAHKLPFPAALSRYVDYVFSMGQLHQAPYRPARTHITKRDFTQTHPGAVDREEPKPEPPPMIEEETVEEPFNPYS